MPLTMLHFVWIESVIKKRGAECVQIVLVYQTHCIQFRCRNERPIRKKTRWPTKNYLNTYERYKNHKIQRVLDRSHLHCCCKCILIADWNRWFIECMVCFYEAVRSILERLNVCNGIDRNCKFWCISGNTFIC